MASDRHERIAENEANARDMNERFGLGTFICECGNPECRQVLQIPREAYGSVRADARKFIVAPGHEMPDAEDVVERDDGWYVVRKHDDVAPIVDERDPRSR